MPHPSAMPPFQAPITHTQNKKAKTKRQQRARDKPSGKDQRRDAATEGEDKTDKTRTISPRGDSGHKKQGQTTNQRRLRQRQRQRHTREQKNKRNRAKNKQVEHETATRTLRQRGRKTIWQDNNHQSQAKFRREHEDELKRIVDARLQRAQETNARQDRQRRTNQSQATAGKKKKQGKTRTSGATPRQRENQTNARQELATQHDRRQVAKSQRQARTSPDRPKAPAPERGKRATTPALLLCCTHTQTPTRAESRSTQARRTKLGRRARDGCTPCCCTTLPVARMPTKELTKKNTQKNSNTQTVKNNPTLMLLRACAYLRRRPRCPSS